jgi:succinoglycan biosynthesis protein ExoU
VIRRSFLLAHGLRNDETVRFGEDFILFAAALALGARFRVVDCCGYVAVSRAESLSHTHTAQDLRALLAAEQSLARRHLRSGERGALRRHMRHVQDKYQYRLALDAKQSGNLLEAMKLALSDWHALGFMCLETARAKARAIVGDGGDVAPRSTFAS